MPDAIVIGSGVIGLSSALRLQEAGYSVKIITRELPQDTTSSVAGAVWSGSGMQGGLQQWAATSLRVFQELAKDDDSGVLITRYREFFYHQAGLPWYKDLLDYCEAIPADDLPEGYTSGIVSDVPLVQTPKYMTYLHNRFIESGGTLEQREIKSLDDVSEHQLVINCTGVQARHVANDEAVHPIWGQVLLANAPHITESFMDDAKFTYVFPRKDGVVLGGIHVHDRWEREVDDAVTRDIISRCQRLVPELGEVDILRIPVGLRPGRHAVRLERETLSDDCTVIHNYGHSGVGYTLSWGCADEVVKLAQ